jgi:hypothetical protein
MTRKLAILFCLAATTAVLSLPAGAGAAGGLVGKLSASQCSAEKSKIGKKRFAKKYGRKAMPACIKKTRPAARRAVATATADCQEELIEWGAEFFYEDWVSFAECVEYYADGELNGWGDDEDEEDPGDEEDDPLL